MLDFTKLWDKRYLFGPNPLGFSRSDYIFWAAAVALILASVILKVLATRLDQTSPQKRLLSRYFHLTATAGILTLVWSGFRFENIPWLSTHFLVLAMFVIWLAWLGFILKYSLWQYRRDRTAWQEENLKRKYLPR